MMSLDSSIRIHFLHVGTSAGLLILFSYSSNPILPLLVSSWEWLEINASLNISWITFCHVVLTSSSLSLSLAYFPPRALDSLIFLSWHFLLACCHFLLDVLGYVHWSCSPFYILHLSWASYFILQSICLFLFSTQNFYYKKVKGMFSHSYPFWDTHLDHLIIFFLLSLGWKWIKDILL